MDRHASAPSHDHPRPLLPSFSSMSSVKLPPLPSTRTPLGERSTTDASRPLIIRSKSDTVTLPPIRSLPLHLPSAVSRPSYPAPTPPRLHHTHSHPPPTHITPLRYPVPRGYEFETPAPHMRVDAYGASELVTPVRSRSDRGSSSSGSPREPAPPNTPSPAFAPDRVVKTALAGYLASIPGPAAWMGPYPTAYLQHDPVHPSNKDGGPAAQAKLAARPSDKRSGQPSVNPWDYLYDPTATPTPAKKKGKTPEDNKHRQNFRHWQIEIMEVLFGIQPTPSRFEKQRLGAWLGVKSNRITIWFQNRRQDLSRRQKALASSSSSPMVLPDEPTVPPPPGRTNLGNWDPNSGKWRTVPTSCIGALAPAGPDREAIVRVIVTGELNREDFIRANPGYLDGHPSVGERRGDEGLVHVPPAGCYQGQAGRMDDVMAARDVEAGTRQYRRMSASPGRWDGDNDALLQLLPSDPPSMGLVDMLDSDGIQPEEEDEEVSQETPVRNRQKREDAEFRDYPLLAVPRPKLGRATSFDLLASSMRAKQLSQRPPLGRSETNINIGFKRPATVMDINHLATPLDTDAKRPRGRLQQPTMSIPRGGKAAIKTKPRSSFSRAHASPPMLGYARADKENHHSGVFTNGPRSSPGFDATPLSGRSTDTNSSSQHIRTPVETSTRKMGGDDVFAFSARDHVRRPDVDEETRVIKGEGGEKTEVMTAARNLLAIFGAQ